MANEKKTSRKKFRVAVSGSTVDGREISPVHLREAAENFNPDVYAARVNVEHYLSPCPSSEFSAMGDVTALSTEDITEGPLTVQSARIVTWRLNAKLYFYPGPESEPILAAAESSFRKWLAEQGLIGQDVALSAIAAALHVHGVQRVEIIEPTQNMAISDIQAARCESLTISEGGRNE
ncbi:GPO family capsid scaffolding protein [Escherichia coli]|uniref:GPO family capsid scaffolding protein n=1 Tax=Escherichia coli TaxID=562 RepID=UPI000B7D0E12|nr:GPO family capsid scaffolding protein [Escherichia coli]